jgi:hypothetical protein
MNDAGSWAAFGVLLAIMVGQFLLDIRSRAEEARNRTSISKLRKRIRRLEVNANLQVQDDEDSDVYPIRSA